MQTNESVLPPAVILGSDCLTGLQTARILWRKSIPVIGVAHNPKIHYCRTRSVVRTIAFSEFSSDSAAFFAEITAQYGIRPVVIPCSDYFAWCLNNQRDKLGDCCDFLLPAPDTLQMLADKARFYRYAAEHQLPLPETRFAKSIDEAEKAAKQLSFPLIVKPPRRTTEWMTASGGLKVLKVRDMEELLNKVPALLCATEELILQKWIRGTDANSRELSVCFDRQNQLLCGLVLRKIRQWPPEIGTGSLSVEMQTDDVLHSGIEILKHLNYIGPGQLEFKKDDVDGIYYIIEMNAGRIALNFPLCEACGMEMIYTLYCAAAGRPLPQARHIARPGSKWICWKRDLISATVHRKQGRLTLREWISSLRGPKWSADIQLDDLMPFVADMGSKLSNALLRRSASPRREGEGQYECE